MVLFMYINNSLFACAFNVDQMVASGDAVNVSVRINIATVY